MRFTLMLLTSSLLFFACNKPEIDDCRKACWNYNKIMFWEKVEKDVKSMTPQKAVVFRAKRNQEFQAIAQREEDRGLLNCVTKCQHEASNKQVTCMQEAQSAAAMSICME